jgi:hypothetical protein
VAFNCIRSIWEKDTSSWRLACTSFPGDFSCFLAVYSPDGVVGCFSNSRASISCLLSLLDENVRLLVGWEERKGEYVLLR